MEWDKIKFCTSHIPWAKLILHLIPLSEFCRERSNLQETLGPKPFSAWLANWVRCRQVEVDPTAAFFIWVEDETLNGRTFSGEEGMLARGAAAPLSAVGLLGMLTHLCLHVSPEGRWLRWCRHRLHCSPALSGCVNLKFDVAWQDTNFFSSSETVHVQYSLQKSPRTVELYPCVMSLCS